MKSHPNIATIPAGGPFLDRLADRILAFERPEDPWALARVTVLLPTRRACRALTELLGQRAAEREAALLLPVIRPLGDVDEETLDGAFDGAGGDLPPAIGDLSRRLMLARLILHWRGTLGVEGEREANFAYALDLARELADLIDAAETEGADLTRIGSLVPDRYAAHLQLTRTFLDIVTRHWPEVLEGLGAVDPARRRNLALDRLAVQWTEKPPSEPVIAAGSTGSIPATARLLNVIARLPQGEVILPGLDREMDEDSWAQLTETHPQFGLKTLLGQLDCARTDVREADPAADGCAARRALMNEALRPADTTEHWPAATEALDLDAAVEGLRVLEAPDEVAEARAIALALREVLETPGKRAALVTPDRGLAARVVGELRRWDVTVEDSAGRPLATAVPGAFLRLLAAAAAERFAPVALLDLLKHPLSAAGLPRPRFARLVGVLDKHALRGVAPADTLAHLATWAAQTERREGPDCAALIAHLSDILSPLIAHTEQPLAALLDGQLAAAEALAATDTEEGADCLWAGDAGEALAGLIEGLQEADETVPVTPAAWPRLLTAFMAGRVVRPRRPAHHRLFIWGPLEARLQHTDLMILGGLNEGTWPAPAAIDPWLNRPMRTALGLSLPERRIGQAAHDFAQLASAPRVILSRAQKVEGTPAIRSRWLARLMNLLDGTGLGSSCVQETELLGWAGGLDAHGEATQPLRRPRPTPPVAARPRELNVTEIETLIRDPYAVYARRVLGLKPLDAHAQPPGPREFGIVVHDVLEAFVRVWPRRLPDDPEAELLRVAQKHFQGVAHDLDVMALWWPRFAAMIGRFAANEAERRRDSVDIKVELSGELTFPAPAGDFTLKGRVDRIDVLGDGSVSVSDYKTGDPPSGKQAKIGLAPQLPLLAWMAEEGVFEGLGPATCHAIIYIPLKEKATDKVIASGTDLTELVAVTAGRLRELVAKYDRPNRPYVPHLIIQTLRGVRPYDHLARVGEWGSPGDGEEGL